MQSQHSPNLSDIQKSLGIPKSTLHGMLQELCEADILSYREDGKAYSVGTELIQQSAYCLSKVNLIEELKIVAAELGKELNCNVSCGVLDKRNVVYIFQSSSNQVAVKNAGLVIPAHACSIGKILLSQLDDAAIRSLYENVTLELFTERTISSIDNLIAEINDVRKNGYATDVAEFSPFIACLSCPIEIEDKYMAGMSVTISINNFSEEVVQNMYYHLKKATDRVLQRLGVILDV